MKVGVESDGGVEFGRVFEAVGVALEGPRVKAVRQIQLRNIRDGYCDNLGNNFITSSWRSDGCGSLGPAIAHRCG